MKARSISETGEVAGAPLEFAADEFRKRAVEILESLGPEGLVVTKDGRALAHIMPPPPPPARFEERYGSLKGLLITNPDDDLFSSGTRIPEDRTRVDPEDELFAAGTWYPYRRIEPAGN